MHAKAKFRPCREHQKANAVACQAELWASPEMQGTRRYRGLPWLFTELCWRSAEHEAGKFAVSSRRAEQTGLANEALVGFSAELC